MGQQFEKIETKHRVFIESQKIFFVATGPAGRKINLSPKGMDAFRVINDNRIAWLNVTGSGNETAAHLLEDDRMTVMFCSFDKEPLILRLYGQAKAVHIHDPEWEENNALFPDFPGKRQIFLMDVNLVQSSCGFAVPLMEYQGERDLLIKWAENQGEEGVQDYWQSKNTTSIDKQPTGIEANIKSKNNN